MHAYLIRFVACVGTAVFILSSGCTRPYSNPYGYPYGTPPYGNSPWGAAPGAAPPALPPPQNSSALPSVPALPPAAAPLSSTLPGSAGPGAPPPAGARLPDWSNPGTLNQQQERAQYFDPYADANAATEIVGGRPREFQKQLAEPVRARGFRDTRWPF